MSAGKVANAADCYRELVSMEPLNADLRNNLGIILARQGDLAGAIAEFEAALKADPAHAAARRNLERLRARQWQTRGEILPIALEGRAGLKSLRRLILRDTMVTHDELKHLAELT
jgi:tetratricopeptide (TPR) repeat protein